MTTPNTIIADMQLIETNLRQQIAHLNDEIAGLKSDVAYVEKQWDEYKNDAAYFRGQVNRLAEWNNNLVSHRDELLAEVESLRKQRDELLGSAIGARNVIASAILANWEGATDDDVSEHVTIKRLDSAIVRSKGGS